MAGLMLLDKISIDLQPNKETVLEYTCLVAEYMSYMAAAGFSLTPVEVSDRRIGALKFLAKFPNPRAWLSLSVEEQLRCTHRERKFLHYLFLRHLLPLPAAYLLAARPHLSEMGCQLMNQEIYQLYSKIASRLGYTQPGIQRQFQSLLCLMAWAQRPMDTLTISDLDAFISTLKSAYSELDSRWLRASNKNGLPASLSSQLPALRNVLYHLGIFPSLTNGNKELTFEEQWRQIPPDISGTVHRYLQQLALSFRPRTLKQEKSRLFQFFSWLLETMPEVTAINQIKRRHIEAFKEYLTWAKPRNRLPGTRMRPATRYHILSSLYYLLHRITEWQWEEATQRPIMFYQDLPSLDQPLPRFLDEAEAARFLQVARSHTDLFTKVCGITLMLTGLRKSEFLDLTTDCIVRLGEGYWLRVPLGKTHRDRFVPLHPEVKQALDEWMTRCPPQQPYDFLFTSYGRRIGRGKIDLAVERIAKGAGINSHVTPHRLRHTLATLAINRGMPLESIAALLGHRSLWMTLVYARIGNRTVQQEYSAVTQRLEQLCNLAQSPGDKEKPVAPTIAEGAQMRRLRRDHWRMLGNGYCTRPEGTPCEYEMICESCPCFSTSADFLPILNKQRQDAKDKGQTQRAQIIGRLINNMNQANENVPKKEGDRNVTDRKKVKQNLGKPES